MCNVSGTHSILHCQTPSNSWFLLCWMFTNRDIFLAFYPAPPTTPLGTDLPYNTKTVSWSLIAQNIVARAFSNINPTLTDISRASNEGYTCALTGDITFCTYSFLFWYETLLFSLTSTTNYTSATPAELFFHLECAFCISKGLSPSILVSPLLHCGSRLTIFFSNMPEISVLVYWLADTSFKDLMLESYKRHSKKYSIFPWFL